MKQMNHSVIFWPFLKGGDDDESEEYYYYEDPSSSDSANGAGSRCVNTQHTVTASDSGEIIELAGLEECTLYSLDITPTAVGGETLQGGLTEFYSRKYLTCWN